MDAKEPSSPLDDEDCRREAWATEDLKSCRWAVKKSLGNEEEVKDDVGGCASVGVVRKTEGKRDEIRSCRHYFASNGGINAHSAVKT